MGGHRPATTAIIPGLELGFVLLSRFVSNLAWTFGAIAAFLAAWSRLLGWRASLQLPPEKAQRRNWYDAKWHRIKTSAWNQLPEAVIAWVVRARGRLSSIRTGRL